MTRRGRLIVVEGIDGSGTTTQTQRLCEALRARGQQALETREPTSGPVGALLRDFLSGRRSEPPSWDMLALLFAADRLDHVTREIEPALAAGQTVVSDRYDLSTLAYQSLTAPGGAAVLPWLRAINGRAPRPSLTLVLDVRAETAEERRRLRGGPAELFEKTELQRRLATIYARAETLVEGDLLVHVDGEGDAEQVAARVLAAVR